MALQNIKTHFESTNINDFKKMLDNICVVSEKIQASSFHVKRSETGFNYYKSGSKNEMTKVDRTLVKYYENAIKYFKSIPNEQMESMPIDWKFGFDYMTENKTVDNDTSGPDAEVTIEETKDDLIMEIHLTGSVWRRIKISKYQQES